MKLTYWIIPAVVVLGIVAFVAWVLWLGAKELEGIR